MQMRFDPIGWLFGCNSFAVSGSLTISAIFSQTKFAAVSLAALSSPRLLYTDMNVSPPRFQRAWYFARRSLSPSSSAPRSGISV